MSTPQLSFSGAVVPLSTQPLQQGLGLGPGGGGGGGVGGGVKGWSGRQGGSRGGGGDCAGSIVRPCLAQAIDRLLPEWQSAGVLALSTFQEVPQTF